MLQSMRSAAKYIWIVLIVAFVGGFLLAETSGLIGRGPVTSSTAVATVNGDEILVSTWYARAQQIEQQNQQRYNRSATLEDQAAARDEAFNQLVMETLLAQEYRKRGIVVTDDEIREAAKYSPPAEIMQNPELQTNGQFDVQKWQRFLGTPQARQSGMLLQLEAYYRDAIPRQKLLEQVTAGFYVPDEQLWQSYRDQHDTVDASYIAFRPDTSKKTDPPVSNSEIEEFFNTHKKDFERPGQAVVSILWVRRIITAQDTAASRARLEAIRSDIVSGKRTFEDAAKAESTDSLSAVEGGSLGWYKYGKMVPQFDSATKTLKPGEISGVFKTQFGFHIIKLEDKKGDSVHTRHILIPIQQTDSNATRIDKVADSLSRMAASTDKPGHFDSAAKALGLTPIQSLAVEGQGLTIEGKYVPSVATWAFSGAKVGETSDLYDSEDGYFLARLDKLTKGGEPKLDDHREEIRRGIAMKKKVQALVPTAERVARSATQSTLEAAAQAQGLPVEHTGPFTRVTGAVGIGRFNEAVGAAFALKPGVVSAPVATDEAVFILRVDKKTEANRSVWELQRQMTKQQMMGQARQQRLREFFNNLRESAKIVDRRKEIEAAQRRAST